MNLHERGKRLSKIVTAAIGVAAVIGASALGLHDWADIVTTKAQATSTASGESDDSATDSSSTDSSSTGSSSTSNGTQGSAVTPGNGTDSHATTNGS